MENKKKKLNYSDKRNNAGYLKFCLGIFNSFILIDDLFLHFSDIKNYYYYMHLLLLEIIIFYLWILIRKKKISFNKNYFSFLIFCYFLFLFIYFYQNISLDNFLKKKIEKIILYHYINIFLIPIIILLYVNCFLIIIKDDSKKDNLINFIEK